MTVQILLGGFDITDYLKSGFTYKEYRSLDRDQFIINDLNLRLENLDGLFSPGNGNYLFEGGNIRGKSLEVLADGVSFWKGVAEKFDEAEDSQISTLKAKNSLALLRNTPINRTETGVNPATLALDILRTEVGLDDSEIDIPSFERSATVLSQGGLLVNATWTTDKRKTVSKALEELARVSCADFFTTRGKLAFLVYEEGLGAYSVLIDNTVGEGFKRTGQETRYIKNDYVLDYSGSTGETDSDNNNSGEESRINFGTDSISLKYGSSDLLTITTQAGGVFLGDQYIARQAFPKDWIYFSLPMSVEPNLSLKTPIGVTFPKYGYSGKAFDVMSIQYDFGRQYYTVGAIEQ